MKKLASIFLAYSCKLLDVNIKNFIDESYILSQIYSKNHKPELLIKDIFERYESISDYYLSLNDSSLNPNYLFDAEYFQDLLDSSVNKTDYYNQNLLRFYLSNFRTLDFTPSEFFDYSYYVNRYYSKFDQVFKCAWADFYLNEKRNFRNPNSYFNSEFYMSEYEDVKNSKYGASEHFLKYGRSEGRVSNAGELTRKDLIVNESVKTEKVQNSVNALSKEQLLEIIVKIRELDIRKLGLADLQERLIPEFGLNNENLEEQPVDILAPYLGTGLKLWQYPNQFSHLIKLLASNLTDCVTGYLEIGSRWCGTFIVLSEIQYKYSKSSNFTVIACDLIEEPSNLKNYRELCGELGGPEVIYFKGDSKDTKLLNLVKDKNVNSIFIDGDHTSEGALSDYLSFRANADLLIFHDIDSDAVSNLRQVWQIVKELESSSDIYEFIEQYPSVQGNYLGIGCVIKST